LVFLSLSKNGVVDHLVDVQGDARFATFLDVEKVARTVDRWLDGMRVGMSNVHGQALFGQDQVGDVARLLTAGTTMAVSLSSGACSFG
jgi:hypothetical protein